MSYFDAYVAYKFIQILTQDWEKTDAFKQGIIDKNGKILKKRRSLKTGAEKKAYTIFHVLVWKIRRILQKLPVLKSKLGSIAAAVWFLKDHCEQNNISWGLIQEQLTNHLQENHPELFTLNEEARLDDTILPGRYEVTLPLSNNHTTVTVNEELEPVYTLGNASVYKLTSENSNVKKDTIVTEFQSIEEVMFEEAPANAIGSGAVAGHDKPMPGAVQKRFKVDPVTFGRCKRGKKKYARYSRYFDLETDVGKSIHDFARKNPKKPICIENEEDEDQVIYLRYNRRGGGGNRRKRAVQQPLPITQSELTTEQTLLETRNTVGADVNEILLAWYLADSRWSRVKDGSSKQAYEKAQSQLSDEEFENQSERAWVMADAIDQWAARNGYKGNIVAVWWTARPNVLSKAFGKPVDSRKNPTDVLVKFSDGQFLGISAKSTKSKGDIGFKNPGVGTFDSVLGLKIADANKKAQIRFADENGLSASAASRKREIRSDPAMVQAANLARDQFLSRARNALFTKLSGMKPAKLREFILDECMDAKPVEPRYIKVTGKGRGPYTADISDPLANDKLTLLTTKTPRVVKVGNDSIGIQVDNKKIMKIRFKFESQAMASSLKLSCEPW